MGDLEFKVRLRAARGHGLAPSQNVGQRKYRVCTLNSFNWARVMSQIIQ
jgi:hypothetical protein